MVRLLFLLSFILMASYGISQESNFYKLKATTIDGEDFSFDQLRGKKVLIVNTASRCSLSPQFKSLQELYDRFKDQNFIILAFPQNDFANREPGNNEEIQENLQKRFGISFPLMEKIAVKSEEIHPVYSWLTRKELNGVADSEIKWNFQKYLIDENGQLVRLIEPMKKPDGDEVICWIEGLD